MDERRTLRVSEAVREELTELIGFELDDPRLTSVEVSEANVSPDGKYAHVKVVVRGDEGAKKEALAGLDHAKSYIRRELASRLQLRHVPELHFDLDKHADVDNRIDFLIKRAKRSTGKK
jgi:ribosome-binding factor A